VKTIPDDPDAHFQLAATAERLKNKDEAIKEYTTYLKMDPEGIHVKAARKALAALAPTQK
jgi:predicted TPR repeat methyltransferase